ncbi:MULTISPECIES: hypothetical protein [Microcystis]|uniref:hypothetical protein n=1 Tax=Microcystis TaxID=1125 RepID=UPI0002FF5C9D|nr:MULTISPECIES: hypothetical protein [Microcystis]MDB9509550.1 hypothetical protein [Microcystis aeruginosa CS-338/01]UZO77545.1 hypothetical protein M8120_06155 [Microcystis aeruginosa str. Chao 1910]
MLQNFTKLSPSDDERLQQGDRHSHHPLFNNLVNATHNHIPITRFRITPAGQDHQFPLVHINRDRLQRSLYLRLEIN